MSRDPPGLRNWNTQRSRCPAPIVVLAGTLTAYWYQPWPLEIDISALVAMVAPVVAFCRITRVFAPPCTAARLKSTVSCMPLRSVAVVKVSSCRKTI